MTGIALPRRPVTDLGLDTQGFLRQWDKLLDTQFALPHHLFFGPKRAGRRVSANRSQTMSRSTNTSEKPPTLKSSAFRNWIRVNLLSPHLKSIAPEEKTLDLACGWGFYFQINPNAFGIEIDGACVEYLQKE